MRIGTFSLQIEVCRTDGPMWASTPTGYNVNKETAEIRRFFKSYCSLIVAVLEAGGFCDDAFNLNPVI